MTKKEFEEWFLKNIDTMVEMNIMHYNADRAKDVHAILKILYPEIQELRERLDNLERIKSKRVKKRHVKTDSD